jgi:hypothetical protein
MGLNAEPNGGLVVACHVSPSDLLTLQAEARPSPNPPACQIDLQTCLGGPPLRLPLFGLQVRHRSSPASLRRPLAFATPGTAGEGPYMIPVNHKHNSSYSSLVSLACDEEM